MDVFILLLHVRIKHSILAHFNALNLNAMIYFPSSSSLTLKLYQMTYSIQYINRQKWMCAAVLEWQIVPKEGHEGKR